MKPKKNPKADLNRKWVLFLQIGFILVLFLTLQAMQWESGKEKPQETSYNFDDPFVEETPPSTVIKEATPPPPPKPIPTVLEFIENDSKKTETDVAPTDPALPDIPEPGDIVDAKKEETPVTVPFIAVEDVPVFPGCESLKDNEERKACMSDKISKFVNKNFNTGIGEEIGLSGINRVIVTFVVNKEGEVEQVRSRAPRPELEKEAERVVNLLPKMKPGMQRGKPVPVSYSIPIIFRVQN